MATPNSPLRAPPLNASNMGSDQAQLRSSNGSPMMPPTSTPASGPVFFTPQGERWSREDLRKAVALLTAARPEGRHIPSGFQHMVLWMIQQHYPDHAWFYGRQIPPPPDTLPRLRHLGLQTGQAAQGRPQASSPNMIPPGTARPGSSGVQRLQGMTIDPTMANSSTARLQNAMSPMQMRPSSSTPVQGRPPFTPAPTSFARSPSQVHSSGISRAPPAMSFTPGSPAAFVFQNDQAIRSPSNASPYRPGQAQYSPPLTPGRSLYSPGTGGVKLPQQNPLPPQNGYTTGAVPPTGMFAAPPSRPSSAQSHNGQVRGNQPPNVGISVYPEHSEETSGTNAQQYQDPKWRASIDAAVANAMRLYTPQQGARYKEKFGNNYQYKVRFLQMVNEQHRVARLGHANTVQRPPSMTAISQVGATPMPNAFAGNKRKQPQTAAEQPKSKRRAVEDLTIDNPPSVSPPPPAGPKKPPIPTHQLPRPANADAHEHALKHGVHLPDLHMKLYRKEEVELAKSAHQQDIRNAQARLDPVPQKLKDLLKSVKDVAAQTMTPEAGAPTAKEDVKTAEPGHESSEDPVSRTASPSLQQPLMQEEDSVGEERCSRSPEQFIGGMSEQTADLEYELGFFEHTDTCV